MNTAAKVRAHRAKNPHLYCASGSCLWRIIGRNGEPTPCQKHAIHTRHDAHDPDTCPCNDAGLGLGPCRDCRDTFDARRVQA